MRAYISSPWIASYPPGVPESIDTLTLGTMVDFLDDAVHLYAERDAFISGSTGTKLSYSDLDDYSGRVASYFQNVLQLPQGSRVALMLHNVLQYPVCMFGLLRAGYVVVNVNPMCTPRELEHQLRDAGAVAIVLIDLFAHTLSQVIGKTSVEHVVVSGLADMMTFFKRNLVNFVIHQVKSMVPAYDLPGAVAFRQMLALGKQSPFRKVDLQPEDLAFLQYTGGTTGVAKGAMLTHRNVLANVHQVKLWCAPFMHTEQPLLSITVLPLYHIFALGTSLTFTAMGGTNVLVSDPRDMDALVSVLRRYPAVSIPGVNTLFKNLLDHPEIKKVDFSALRLAICGGAAVQQSVVERWQTLTSAPLIEGYGLTECAPTVAINPFDSKPLIGSIGLPLPSTEVAIRDLQGQDVPVGHNGELCVRGPQVMLGYWQRPAETRAVMTDDGFLRTGDVAVMNEQGFLRIVNRLKDMVLVSGFNVYPNEIEDVVMLHPGVREAAAVGRPSETTGEELHIHVVKKSPALTAEMLLSHCRQHLSAYKVPNRIIFEYELPKSDIGKVLRRALRAPEEQVMAAESSD